MLKLTEMGHVRIGNEPEYFKQSDRNDQAYYVLCSSSLSWVEWTFDNKQQIYEHKCLNNIFNEIER